MKKYRTKSEWFSLIQEQKASGQSIALFCRQKGIHPTLFYRKRRELCPAKETQSFVEVKRSSVPHRPMGRPELRIAIGDVEIYPGAERDMEYLSSLIKTAREVSGASFQ